MPGHANLRSLPGVSSTRNLAAVYAKSNPARSGCRLPSFNNASMPSATAVPTFHRSVRSQPPHSGGEREKNQQETTRNRDECEAHECNPVSEAVGYTAARKSVRGPNRVLITRTWRSGMRRLPGLPDIREASASLSSPECPTDLVAGNIRRVRHRRGIRARDALHRKCPFPQSHEQA
jgi:hypothetical protein